MPGDVYAAISALARAEITRTLTQPACPPAKEAATPDEIVTARSSAEVASSAHSRRRLRTRATAVLRRLVAVRG
ncbi:hypothetical protein ACFZBP_36820 [Streptomyces sp. NPDC008086]|uniref:hypothetical protein n=1 Tax=Streptomyces sp. NPDC008086 TaxID=3364807 RepID=UPI0036F16103